MSHGGDPFLIEEREYAVEKCKNERPNLAGELAAYNARNKSFTDELMRRAEFKIGVDGKLLERLTLTECTQRPLAHHRAGTVGR